MSYSIIFLDTETTGIDNHDRLIQLCYKLHGWQGMFNKFYTPPVPISFEAMSVHHITPDHIANSPTFEDSGDKEKLQTLLDESIFVAHNAPFDIEMLRREGVHVGLYIDTLKVCQFLLDEPIYKLQYLRYKLGIDVKHAKAHDAQGDVEVLQALWLWLMEYMQPRSENVLKEMIDISQRPMILRRIPFGKYKGMAFQDLPKDYLEWLDKQPNWDGDLRYTIDYYTKRDGK